MTELGFVEAPCLRWLADLGWTVRKQADMQRYERPEADPLVEPLLVEAVRRINPAVRTDADARRAVEVLRTAIADPDPLAANRRTLDLLRDGVPLELPSAPAATTVRFIAFEQERQHLNTFVATNQHTVRGTAAVRADTVLLVNGVPLVVAEFKCYLSGGKDWKEGVRQLHRYMKEAPKLLAPSVICAAADEFEFRYGTVALVPDPDEQTARLQLDHWRPWLSLYPEVRGYWHLPATDPRRDDDAVRQGVRGLLRPAAVLDFLQHFVVFETKKGRTVKKAARYQQFEAANEIADRTLALAGQPDATAQDRTGLIWHTQGSGKSLTMIFAGLKLRRHPKLQSPTVLIVVDRTDLKTQLGDEFEDCDYPNVSKALGVADLKARLRARTRETVVTTVQCFQRMNDLEPNLADNTVLLIDECHRSQKGGGEGFAVTMRAKLPNAFRYGFTGTPIDRTMVNTHRAFGPENDGKQERYLSYYGIRQAIRDGATLPVHYLLRVVPLAVDETPLNTKFEQMCAEMELEDDEAKDYVQKQEAKWKQLAKDPRRMRQVAEAVVEHFLAHPDPNGFKAQLVAVDRDACGKYKDLLDELLIRRGLSKPAADGFSEVVVSAGFNDLDLNLTRFHRTKEATDHAIDHFKLTPGQWEAWNRDHFGDDRERWRPPLKILVVCDKLLTGFDAPVEQVMYLDKPLRDHTLLQAMARTNRPLPEMEKSTGLVVDFFGVFEDVQKALDFDEDELEEAAIDWQKLRDAVPAAVGQAMSYFAGIRIADTKDCLLACLLRLKDEAEAKQFRDDFKHLETLWEALSPDECLYPHGRDYSFLCGMYLAYLRRNRRQRATNEELAAKTRKLIREHSTFLAIAEGVPVYVIDADYIAKTKELPTPADRAAELEKALTGELVEGEGGFAYKKLGERLVEIVKAKAGDLHQMIHDLETLVSQVNALKGEPEKLGLTGPGEYALFTVARGFAPHGTETSFVVKAATGIAERLRKQKCLTPGWADNPGTRKKLRTALQVACWEAEWEALDLCPADADDDPPFLTAAVEELSKAVP